MSPLAEPNAAPAEVAVREELLEDGEIVLLAIKPSGWFVAMVSWPVVLLAAVVAAGAYFAADVLPAGLDARAAMLVCLAAAVGRVLAACFQWTGHLYVLTNLRLMRVRGAVNPDIWQCPLRQVRQIELAATPAERPLRLGSLLIFVGGEETPQGLWSCIARPEEIHHTVLEAIRRAK